MVDRAIGCYLAPSQSHQYRVSCCLQRHCVSHNRMLFRLLPYPDRIVGMETSNQPAASDGPLELWKVGPSTEHHLNHLARHHLGLHLLPDCCSCHNSDVELEPCLVVRVHDSWPWLVLRIPAKGIRGAECADGHDECALGFLQIFWQSFCWCAS